MFRLSYARTNSSLTTGPICSPHTPHGAPISSCCVSTRNTHCRYALRLRLLPLQPRDKSCSVLTYLLCVCVCVCVCVCGWLVVCGWWSQVGAKFGTAATVITMASYPGVLTSVVDYFLTDAGRYVAYRLICLFVCICVLQSVFILLNHTTNSLHAA